MDANGAGLMRWEGRGLRPGRVLATQFCFALSGAKRAHRGIRNTVLPCCAIRMGNVRDIHQTQALKRHQATDQRRVQRFCQVMRENTFSHG